MSVNGKGSTISPLHYVLTVLTTPCAEKNLRRLAPVPGGPCQFYYLTGVAAGWVSKEICCNGNTRIFST